MSIQVSELQTYSDQDLLTIWRWAIANGACGQKREINGRSIEFPPLDVMLDAITQMEMRIAAANGGTIAKVCFGDNPLRQLPPFPGFR